MVLWSESFRSHRGTVANTSDKHAIATVYLCKSSNARTAKRQRRPNRGIQVCEQTDSQDFGRIFSFWDFRILHVDDSNIFDWQIAIFGPPGTCYEGGYFKAHIRFPGDYPFSAPSFRFLTKIWHPNIYENGEVCISILHPPIDDPQGGELPGERWNPTQSVRTVLLSIISILNDPNTFSPANVDASVAFRNWQEGKDNKYKDVIQRQVSVKPSLFRVSNRSLFVDRRVTGRSGA